MPSVCHAIIQSVYMGLILVFGMMVIQSGVATASDNTGTYFTNPPEYGTYPDNDVNYTVEYGDIPYFTWRTNLTSLNLVLRTTYDQASWPLMTSFLDVEYSKDLIYPDGTFTSKYGSGFYLLIEDAETDYAVAMSMYFYIVAPGAAISSSTSSPPSGAVSSATKSTTKTSVSSVSAQSSISSITASTSTSPDTPSTQSTFDALEPSTPSSSSTAATSSVNSQSKDTETDTDPSNPKTTSIIAASIGGLCGAIVIFGVAIYFWIRRHKRRCRRHRSLYDAANTVPDSKTGNDDTNPQVIGKDGDDRNRTNYSVLATYSPSDDIKARLSPLCAYNNDDGTQPYPDQTAVELPAHQHHSAELPD